MSVATKQKHSCCSQATVTSVLEKVRQETSKEGSGRALRPDFAASAPPGTRASAPGPRHRRYGTATGSLQLVGTNVVVVVDQKRSKDARPSPKRGEL